MTDELSSRLRPVRFGLLFSLLTLLFGFGLGGAFGLWEDSFKGRLKAEAEAVKDTVYKGDEAKMKKITDKSWVYFKRAHMHGGGIGAVAMAVALMLAWVTTCHILKCISATALGVGSLGYSMFWMLAALRAPGLGSTGAAKESLAWLAMPSAGLCLIGLVLAALALCHGCLCRCCCRKPQEDD